MVEEAINKITNIITLYEFYHEDNTYDEFLKLTISKDTAQEIVEGLSQCQCCERHQLNRPCTIQENYNEYHPNTYGANATCTCVCRYSSRCLNRVFA
tara:strand:- start:2580 stop:2870 length:291 start_codon:yes stop_codon:yes gene_type:complete